MKTPEWLPFVGGDDPVAEPFSERAANWAAALSYRDVPPPVRRAAKAQLTSCVGAALRTRTHPLGGRIAEAVPTAGGDATFLGGGQTDPATAAAGNAALSVALEFEGSILGGETGTSSVFVPLAYAEAAGRDGEELLVAQIAANEVAGRLGAAVPTGPFSGPRAAWIHAAAAAVGRGVIEGDNHETIADALSTALSRPSRRVGRSWIGSESGVWWTSDPIRDGIAAIDSARAGIDGPRGLVEAEDGLLSTVTRQPIPAALDALGDRWHTEAVSVKAVPGPTPVAAVAEAALEARGRFDRGRTTIGTVDVYGPSTLGIENSAAKPHLDGEHVPVAAALRAVSRRTAEAVVTGEISPATVGVGETPAAIDRVSDRVESHHDPALTLEALRSTVPEGIELGEDQRAITPHVVRSIGARAALRHPLTVVSTGRRLSKPADPSAVERRLGARVEIRTDAGETFEASVDRPSGVAGAPPAELRATARNKCRASFVALGGSKPDSRQSADRLLAIDEAAALRIDRLVPV